MRDYQMVSPSLEGVLSHDSIRYEGLNRPTHILKIFDAPGKMILTSKERSKILSNPNDRKVIQEYFFDLYGLFLKKFSGFVISADLDYSETVKIQAMLQEMIRIKQLL